MATVVFPAMADGEILHEGLGNPNPDRKLEVAFLRLVDGSETLSSSLTLH